MSRFQRLQHLPDTVRFLESLGFTFHLDWDDELQIDYPEDLTPERIALTLGEYRQHIVRTLKNRAEHDRMQLVGGPFNGERHGWTTCWGRTLHARKVKRAWWAAYQLQEDGRAIFKGYATSEKKARNNQLVGNAR